MPLLCSGLQKWEQKKKQTMLHHPFYEIEPSVHPKLDPHMAMLCSMADKHHPTSMQKAINVFNSINLRVNRFQYTTKRKVNKLTLALTSKVLKPLHKFLRQSLIELRGT
jgi:hypothetical protein